MIALLLAAALAPAAMGADRIEAEQLPGGRVVQDASASGGRALQLPRRKTVRTVVQTAAPTYARVRLRAPRCAGRVRTGGRAHRVTRGGWRFVTVPLAAGQATVSLRRLGTCAVRVDRLEVIFNPAPTTTWQWQLTGPLDLSVPAELYDVDLFDTSAATVARIHALGARAVCYFSAGTRERGRPDPFPASVAGKPLADYPDERWLDVRALDVLGPIIERRLDLCARKGFDAAEADNVDAYANDSGFPLRSADQLRFNRFLARAAHARGLSIGLKNDLDQVKALEPAFDWALNEQCFQYRECGSLRPFTAAGKAVFVAEYELAPSAFCGQARAAGLMAMRKRLELDAVREPCW